MLRPGLFSAVCAVLGFHIQAEAANDQRPLTEGEEAFFKQKQAKLQKFGPGSLRDGFWISTQSHVGFFDTGLEIAMGRTGIESTLGYRHGNFGYFFETGYDHFWDLSQRTQQLNTLKLALGVDWLYYGGHLSTQFSVGFSRLLRDTVIHPAGHWGYYYKVKPVNLRFKLANNFDVEFSPIYTDNIIIETGAFWSMLTQVMVGVGVIWFL